MQNATNLNRYYKYLRESYGEDLMSILLIKSAIWLAPLLKECGRGFDKSVAVILEDKESISQIVEELRGFETSSVKAITLPPKEIKAHFRTCTYAIAFFEFVEGRYTMDNLLYIRDECGEINMDISQRKLAVVFAVGGVPDKYAECFSGFVYIPKASRRKIESDLECRNHFLRSVIDYVLKRPDFLASILEDDSVENFDIVGHILKALICRNSFMDESTERYSVEIDAAIEKLKREWECSSNSDAVCDLFCKTLYHASETLTLQMYNRKRIPGMSEKEMMRSVYYDKEYYYMSNVVFSEICERMDVPYGIKYIMAQLINAGVLVRSGVSRNYNTVHTELVSVYGATRVRLIKLARSTIDWKSDFTLQEILEEKMDGNPEESGITLGWSMNSNYAVKLASDIMNNSILISGKSGSGKTYTLNILSHRIVVRGGTVLALSYNDTFTKIEDSENIRRIKVISQGLPVALLSPVCRIDNSVENEKDLITAVTEVLCAVVHLRTKQKRRLREAVKQAVRDKNETNDIRKLKNALQGADEVSETVYEYYRELLDEVRSNCDMNLFENGKMTILDFSGYPSKTQQFLAELVLSVLWRQFRAAGVDMEDTLYVICDEFQMLNVKQNAVLDQMLREGRKYHVAVMLATQTLASLDASKRAIVQQAATQLYFRPAEGEIKSICRYIDANDPDGWVPEVQSLQIGECIASGRFQINRNTVEHPLKISFRAKSAE